MPVIEYASSVWSPHYAADIRKVERVQRKLTKRLLGCSKLGLSYKCRQTSQVKIGKSWSQTSATWPDLDLQDSFWAHTDESKWLCHINFADRTHSTRGHAYKLLPSHCRVDVRKCFFTERVLKPWNSLPAELYHFSSLSVFKRFIFTVDLSEFVTC